MYIYLYIYCIYDIAGVKAKAQVQKIVPVKSVHSKRDR